MPGKFVLSKSKAGQYHFVLKASNGETIAQSENTTKAAAKNGIASVKRNAGTAATQDDTGE